MDIFFVDRELRDLKSMLNDLGIRMEMATLIPKGQKQVSAEEASSSRLVKKGTCDKSDKCTKWCMINNQG